MNNKEQKIWSEVVRALEPYRVIDKPKLDKQFIRREDGFSVYSVNAFYVRNMELTDEEFGIASNHYDFPRLIPEDEIWLDAEVHREWEFLIPSMILWQQTKDYDRAISFEKRLRENVTDIPFRGPTSYPILPLTIRTGNLTILPGDIHVYLVDGFQVRCRFKTDFIEGGNNNNTTGAYLWMPPREIWIEKSIRSDEIQFIMAHEYFETRLMEELNLTYDEAHKLASEGEYSLRQEYVTWLTFSVAGTPLSK